MGYELDFGALLQYLSLFLEGTAVTLGLTAVAAVCGMMLAVGGAAAASEGSAGIRAFVAGYVELIRNTPFIVQMFFVFFGLPTLGLRLSAIEAVPVGQREAALAFGLKPRLVFALVVLPQALGNVYPALVSQVVITMLESAVVSQIAVVDLTHVADFIQSRNFRAFETYLAITAVYLALAVLMRRLLARCGRRLLAGRAA